MTRLSLVSGIPMLVLISLGCASRVDRFAVRDARLALGETAGEAAERAGSDDEEWRLFIPKAQAINEAENVVISRREFDAGEFFALDDEVFEMISIEVPRVVSSRVFDVERDALLVIYTKGNRPHLSCFGLAQSGTITIEVIREDRIHAEFSLVISARGKRADCGDVEISDKGTYRVKSVKALEPWFGGPSDNPYEALYPPY